MADDAKSLPTPAARAHEAEIDAKTGLPTTGHVWDGIRELNRPLPRWWLIIFYGTIAWALVYMVAYPAIPLWSGATTGVLGYSTRAAVEADMAAARVAQTARLDQIAELPLADTFADSELQRFAFAGGRSAFLVNCVPCHGSGAAGSPGYANLNDDDWLWSGTLEGIRDTIAYGVRSDHPDTRTSLMPAFGAEGILSRNEIAAVAEYVLALSRRSSSPALAATGKAVFADNCAVCHGEDGGGNREAGAPALNDAIWFYGGDRATIHAQIVRPRHGMMPAWVDRLDDGVIKQLAVFVYSLGGGEAAPK
jgi:cytochrome c oxidase cbb3-type subunit 3